MERNNDETVELEQLYVRLMGIEYQLHEINEHGLDDSDTEATKISLIKERDLINKKIDAYGNI